MELMLKGLIFDLGGVLVEWNNAVTYCYIEKNYGIDFNTSKTELEKKLPFVQMGRLGERVWLEEFFTSQGIEPNENYNEIWDNTFKDAKINAHVLKIVRKLKNRGFMIALLSNTEPSRAANLRKREFIDYFDAVVLSCEVGTRKASSLKYDGPKGVDIFKLTVDEMGLIPEECLFIDDTVECIEDARESGITGILFTNSKRLKSDLRNYGIKLG